MWKWEDVKTRRCEDEKMFYRPPLLEEPCAQTLSGKIAKTNIIAHWPWQCKPLLWLHLLGHLSHTLAPWQAFWNIAKHLQIQCYMCLLLRLRLGLGPATQHPNNQETRIAVENLGSNQQLKRQQSWNSMSASWAFQAAVALHTKSWYKEHETQLAFMYCRSHYLVLGDADDYQHCQ